MADAKSFQVTLRDGTKYAVEADSWELAFRKDGESVSLVAISELEGVKEVRVGVHGSLSGDRLTVQGSTTSDALESSIGPTTEESGTVDEGPLVATWSEVEPRLTDDAYGGASGDRLTVQGGTSSDAVESSTEPRAEESSTVDKSRGLAMNWSIGRKERPSW